MKRSILAVPVRKVTGTIATEEQDLLAVEEPLQVRLGDRDISITMRTPGHDEELAAGFLFTEGILHSSSEVAEISASDNAVTVTLQPGVRLDPDLGERHFYMTSSCGVCGKASMDALTASGCSTLPQGSFKIDAAILQTLPARLRESQQVFDRTGGLHAAALFNAEGQLICVREDVGRHNALDKLIGRALLDSRVPLSDYLLLVSGRISFELVQKAVMAGIPILCAVGAPSSLAVETALRFGITLAGFVRDGRFNVYAGPERICF